jgi:hypothetical protein
MTEPTTRNETNWNIDYEASEPIRIRDPVAEALAVLEPGEPFVISYRDVITEAGHSCPTASGAFRITQQGLAALYPDEYPVRSEIEVTMGGPKSDPTYGVMSRIVSFITGAAEEDGFGGLSGGHGGRTNLLEFGDLDGDGPTVELERTDTGEAVRVTYHVGEVPGAGPATQHLEKLIAGTATAAERSAFAEAWHARVETVLTDDELFTVSRRNA